MKYFLIILAGLFVLGCVSSQNSSNKTKYNKTSIVADEEFDLLVAPEYDYESEVPYAEQIKVTTKSSSVSVNGVEKPAKHPVAIKVN